MSKLPDFIHVANLKDIFWNNNSDLYPTNIPDIALYKQINKTRPVFLNPYLGTCVIQGEFNHCIYNDTYYFLTKLEVVDLTKHIYKYQLDYDVMINFIYKSGSIKGILTKSNNPEILEECLQYTVPILADPSHQQIIGFSDSKKKWQEDLEIDINFKNVNLENNLQEVGLSYLEFEEFLYRCKNNFIGKASINKKWDTKETNPIYILDFVPTITHTSWKKFVKDKIEEFLGNVDKSKLIIVKQTSLTDHFNYGKFAVSLEGKAIGSKITENKKLLKIDLSNLEDIIPINNNTGKELTPSTEPKIDHFVYSKQKIFGENKTIIEVGRIPHLPIKQQNKTPTFVLSNPYSDNHDYNSDDLRYNGEAPQKILFTDNSEGVLWHIDKNNIPLLVDNTRKQKDLSTLTLDISNFEETKWPYKNLSYENIPPLGFLIYELIKSRSVWKDLEYIGTKEVTSFEYRSGLTNKIKTISLWGNTKNIWSDISMNELLKINLSPTLALTYMDIDLFSWFTIAPSYIGLSYKYFYNNSWNYQKFFPNRQSKEIWYPAKINSWDIKIGDDDIKNPYNKNRISDFLIKRDNYINSFSLTNEFKLKYPIKKGDIFFSSLSHELQITDHQFFSLPYNFSVDEINDLIKTQYVYSPSLDQTIENVKESQIQISQKEITKVATSWIPIYNIASIITHNIQIENIKNEILANIEGLKRLESFINRRTIDPKYLNNCLVFYLYDGKYKFGIFRNWDETLTLSRDTQQIVSSVNDKTSERFSFFHIQQIENADIDYSKDTSITEVIKNKLLVSAISACKNTTNDRIHFFNKENLEKDTLTFDLKGTDWYLLCHSNMFHLLPKNSDVFITDTFETKTLEMNILNIPSTFSKINQKANFLYYGQTIPLNTKFNFKNDSFKVDILSLDVGDEAADPDFEYKNVVIDEPSDYINTWLSLPKKETKAAEKVDTGQLLMLKERIASLTTNYEQDRFRNELLLEDKKLFMARQREDLDAQKWSSVANIALKGLSSIGGVGAAIATGGMTAAFLGSAAVGAGTSMKSDIEFLLRHPTFMERIGQDERNMMLANTQYLYQRKQNYEHDFKIQTYKLNKLKNSFIKPGVSNRDVIEAYNKKQGFKDISVQILLPSPTQQQQIDYIYTVYGCECISTKFLNTPLQIYNFMNEGIYQFSKIEVGGIESSITNDINIRGIIKKIFENGVKFLKTLHSSVYLEPKTIPTLTGDIVEFDLDKIHEWPREKWDIYRTKKLDTEVITSIKNHPKNGLTDDEYEEYKNKIRYDTDEHLLEDIHRIIHNRKTGIRPPVGEESDPILIANNTLKQQLKELEKQLNQKIQEISNCQTEVEKYKTLYETMSATKVEKKDEIVALNKKLKELNKVWQECEKDRLEAIQQMTRLQTELDECKTDRDDFEKQMKQFETELVQISQAKETCDRVNANEIKNLKAKIKDCEEKIKEKQIEIDGVKNNLQVSVNRAETLSSEYKTLERKLREQTNLAELYKIEKEKLNRDNEYLNNELKLKENEIKGLNSKTKNCETDLVHFLSSLNSAIKDITGKDVIDGEITLSNAVLHYVKISQFITDNAIESKKCERLLKNSTETVERLNKDYDNITKKWREVSDENINLRKQIINPRKIDFDECSLLQSLVKSSDYKLDLKVRDNGFSAFTDLVFYIGESIRRMRASSIDFHLNHYDYMRPIFERLYEIEQIPAIDRAETIIQMNGYTKFVKWLEEGGNKNGDVDKIIAQTNDLKTDMSTMAAVHTLWMLLDELNYLSHRARSEHSEDINNDTDLDFFFKHIYPGQKLNDLYKKLFEINTQVSISKKVYLESVCSGDALAWLDNNIKGIDTSVPTSTIRPDSLPPTTATLRQQNNDEWVLNDEFVFPYFFPIDDNVKHIKAIKPNGEIDIWRNDQLSACFRGAGLKKYAYNRQNKKWSWEVFTTVDYIAPSYGTTGYHREQEVYIRCRQTNLFKLVHSNRKQHWKNKDKIQVPNALKEAIKNKQPFWKYLYVRNWDDFNGDINREYFWSPSSGYKDKPLTIDLVKVFGKRADDAYRLLGILDVAKWWFDAHEKRSSEMRSKYDSLPAIELYYRIFPTDDSTYTNLHNDFYDRLNRNNIITDEFLTTYSLINYIWYHIKRPGAELKSVFEFKNSLKTIDDLCNMSNNWKIRTD